MAAVALVVLDPGHGGELPAGGSSPRGDVGPSGVEEKAICLGVAKATSAALAHRGIAVALTREDDRNLSFRDRVDLAQRIAAPVFLSLHASAGAAAGRGPQIWLHEAARPQPLALALPILTALSGVARAGASRGVKRGVLAVLTPSAHAEATSACLIELDCLANPKAEAWLSSSATQGALGMAIANAVIHYLEAIGVAIASAPTASSSPDVGSGDPRPSEEAGPAPLLVDAMLDVEAVPVPDVAEEIQPADVIPDASMPEILPVAEAGAAVVTVTVAREPEPLIHSRRRFRVGSHVVEGGR